MTVAFFFPKLFMVPLILMPFIFFHHWTSFSTQREDERKDTFKVMEGEDSNHPAREMTITESKSHIMKINAVL